jgi:hypothetical protein
MTAAIPETHEPGRMVKKTAKAKLDLAIMPQRSLLFYTLTAALPVAVILATLLLTQIRGTPLAMIAAIAAVACFVGFVTLLYEITFDIAGYPDYRLPVWSVLYLIVYLINGFAFTIFAMNTVMPGQWIKGVAIDEKTALLDSLYISMSNYIGVTPDPSFSSTSQSARFLSVGQGVVSMFLNVIIITKFVSSF